MLLQKVTDLETAAEDSEEGGQALGDVLSDVLGQDGHREGRVRRV